MDTFVLYQQSVSVNFDVRRKPEVSVKGLRNLQNDQMCLEDVTSDATYRIS